MRIAILSDTHNQVENLEKALNYLRQEDITNLIHCGDLTDADLLRWMEGFRVILTYGNGDTATGTMRENVMALHPAGFAGYVYTGVIGGVTIAATHGHLPGKVDELVRSGTHQYVFCGHSHQHQNEQIGPTRLINPGALGGLKRESRQFCILDLEDGQVEFIAVDSIP